MPTTSRRLWCLARAIHCWQNQSWPDRDLLVLSDGEGRSGIAAAVRAAADPRIHHIHAAQQPTLGDKWNLGIGLLEGPLVAFWADDDWHHPERLAIVAEALLRADAALCGSRLMLAHRVRDARTFLYRAAVDPPFLTSGALVFRKTLWERHRFPARARGEDAMWMMDILRGSRERKDYVALEDERLYVAFVHGENTGNTLDQYDGLPWEKWEGDLGALMGRDRVLFGV